MKVIHTADWHIGQIFYDYSRQEEHAYFLEWLIGFITDEKIDLLLISGDVYDGPNPSAEAQKLFYSFLREVTYKNRQLKIIITAGNHDSASRIEAPNPLLQEMNVTVRGVVKRNSEGDIDLDNLIEPIYNDGNIAAYCLAVPYIRQGDYPHSESYSDGVQQLYHLLYNRVKDKGIPVIAMGHLQATGSELSENDRSERAIIGGVEGISPDAFDSGIIYTALGHLHRAQRVSGRDNVRYSGSPLPMTFAEKNNKHKVVMINIGEVNNHSPYLEIKILIDGPDTSFKFRIEEALKDKSVRLAKISPFYPQRGESKITALTFEQLQEIDPLDVANDYYRRNYGDSDMPQMMQEFIKEAIEEVKS